MGRKVNLNMVLDTFLRVNNVEKQTDEEQRIGREFVKLWPQHGEALNKFRAKPGCGSCRHTLLELFAEEPAKVGKLVRQVNPKEEWEIDHTANRAVSRHRPALTKPQETLSLVGKSFDIPDTPEAYTHFLESQRSKGARYNGLTVRPLDSKMVRLYFY